MAISHISHLTIYTSVGEFSLSMGMTPEEHAKHLELLGLHRSRRHIAHSPTFDKRRKSMSNKAIRQENVQNLQEFYAHLDESAPTCPSPFTRNNEHDLHVNSEKMNANMVAFLAEFGRDEPPAPAVAPTTSPRKIIGANPLKRFLK
jgi:hypothetical protein